jgi:hypothetical protein
MPLVNRNEIWNILGSSAPSFALYCANKETNNAKAVSYMFETTSGFDLSSAMVANMILPILLVDGVIDYSCIDRIFAFVEKDVPGHLQRPTPTPTPTPTVTPTPSGA